MTTQTSHAGPFEVLLRGEEVAACARAWKDHQPMWQSSHVRLRWDWAQAQARRDAQLFVVAPAEQLLADARTGVTKAAAVRHPRLLILPDDTPYAALWELLLGGLKIRSPQRLHTPRLKFDTQEGFIRRFLATLCRQPDVRAIADAWWEGDGLTVLAPTFERLKVPAAAIPGMAAATDSQRDEFEIDETGEFIHWPQTDVHMGWSQFEQAADPHAGIRAQQESRAFNRQYGQAIRTLRKQTGLRQTDIAGLDARSIRRIEHGQHRATAKALARLAAAHGMTTNRYLSALAERCRPHV